jgi:hypothetical protein
MAVDTRIPGIKELPVLAHAVCRKHRRPSGYEGVVPDVVVELIDVSLYEIEQTLIGPDVEVGVEIRPDHVVTNHRLADLHTVEV